MKRKTPKRPSQADIRRKLAQQRKALDKRRASREREYRALLKTLQKTEIYRPKTPVLTRYRKSRINKAAREYAGLLDPKSVFFIPVNKRARDKLLDRAKKLAMKIAPGGIFLDKEGFTKAKLRKSKTRKGEFEIQRSGKIKRGPNAGKMREDIIPVEPIEHITDEAGRLKKIGDSFGKLKPNERLAFRIVDSSGEGMSWHTYKNVDLLLAALIGYKRATPSRLYMLRHVIIEKTTKIDWKEESKERGLGSYRKARRGKRKAKTQQEMGR